VTISKWIALGALLFLVYSCLPSYGERFSLRVTVEVQTPQGLKTGSSVIKFRKKNKAWWYPAAGSGYFETFGEAPIVDLNQGRFLFVLLENSFDHGSIIYLDDKSRLNADLSVKEGWLPTLVTFTNTSDAFTIKKVDPQLLSAMFGRGYELIRIRVERTDESPAFGKIEQVLHIREHMNEPSFQFKGDTDPALKSITWRSFQVGPPK
jgi:hypothetical protein